MQHSHSHHLNHIHFPANAFPELMFTSFDIEQSAIRESLLKHANWDSEQTELLINGNTIQLIQENTDRPIISDTDFINCIHSSICSFDIDPIEYRNRITTEYPDNIPQEIFTYTLISINP